MMFTALPLDPNDIPDELIWQSNRADSTKRQYVHAMQGYLHIGHSLDDIPAWARYARTLSPSRQVYFQAAIGIWAAEMTNRVRSRATLDNIAQV